VGAGRAGHLALEAETDGEAEAIIPVSDFAEAVRLMPEKLRLRVGDVLELSARDIYIRIAKLSVAYPDVSKLPEKFAGAVRPADGFISRALEALKAVGESAVVGLSLSDGKLSALASAQEEASALIVTKARQKGPDTTIHFSLGSFAAAAALGDKLVMRYGKEPTDTALFESPEGWRCWVAPLFVRG
jgi:DNA polymerase III sliding clamp (beta) subunit (PCNA family)